jgi:hypothetical protein
MTTQEQAENEGDFEMLTVTRQRLSVPVVCDNSAHSVTRLRGSRT